MILVIIGSCSLKQSSIRGVRIESSSYCLFWEEKMRLRISVKVAGTKFDKFGVIGKKGSGNSVGKNLEQIRSILSLKNWRNELASDCVLGESGNEMERLRWRIEFRVFRSVRGLKDDLVTHFVRKLNLAFEIRDLTKLGRYKHPKELKKTKKNQKGTEKDPRRTEKHVITTFYLTKRW